MGIRIGVFPLSHTLRATCGTLPCNENELLTHTLRATCGTLLSNENELLTHTLHSKVRYFHVTPFSPMRTNSLLTLCKQGAVLSRYSLFPNENELLTHVTIFGHSKVRYFHVTPFRPRNIIHANPRLLQIAANEPLMNCCEVLKQFGFRGKMYYLCISKVERALNKRVLSSFFAQKMAFFPQRKIFLHYGEKFFLEFADFFSVMLMAFWAMKSGLKLKDIYFLGRIFCNYSGQSSEKLSQKSCGY